MKKRGMRAVMLYIVQRSDVEIFAPAREIDSDYSNMLKKAVEAGVEVIPMLANVSPEKIELVRQILFEISKFQLYSK